MLAPSDPRRHHVRAHFEVLPKAGAGISRISLSLMNLPGLCWTGWSRECCALVAAPRGLCLQLGSPGPCSSKSQNSADQKTWDTPGHLCEGWVLLWAHLWGSGELMVVPIHQKETKAVLQVVGRSSSTNQWLISHPKTICLYLPANPATQLSGAILAEKGGEQTV